MAALFHIFAAGGLACATERVLLLPVDVVKTRLQAQPGIAFHQVLTSLAHENWGAGFFRGLIPVLMTAPMRVVKLFAFRVARQLLENGDSSSSSSSTPSRMEQTLKLVVAGLGAAAVEIILSFPFEVLRVRLQAADANLSTWSCLKDICVKEGASSLLRGIESSLWREVVWSGAYFGTGQLCESLGWRNDKTYFGIELSMLSGVIAAIVTTPFDVVKTRTQISSSPSPSTFPMLFRLATTEGTSVLFSGALLRVLRAVIGVPVGAYVYTAIIQLLTQYRIRT
ncbi:Mitochondrial carrier [Balamuthia mandrillaris]